MFDATAGRGLGLGGGVCFRAATRRCSRTDMVNAAFFPGAAGTTKAWWWRFDSRYY